jgi:hypothetical protein
MLVHQAVHIHNGSRELSAQGQVRDAGLRVFGPNNVPAAGDKQSVCYRAIGMARRPKGNAAGQGQGRPCQRAIGVHKPKVEEHECLDGHGHVVQGARHKHEEEVVVPRG